MDSPLAVILGAGPLIGLSIALRFEQEGFRIALVGLDPDFLDETSATVPDIHTFQSDLGETGSVRDVFSEIRHQLGNPQVLVYHASAGARGAASRLNPATLQRDFRVNAIAPLVAVQEVLPAMRKTGQGTILFTGGGLALKPQADMPSASMGKAALRQLALCLHEELAPEGIHAAIVTIAGFVQRNTGFNPDLVADQFWQLHAEPRERWRSEVVLTP